MKCVFYYATSLGDIGLVDDGKAITQLWFGRRDNPNVYVERETPRIIEAAAELQAYLAGDLRQFSIPIMPKGTDFQQRVWRVLCEIPYGETCSYRDVALAVGNPKSYRVVGMANNRNPLPIFIPCHRVIGADGSLTGYAGGLAIKEKLLALEQQDKDKVILTMAT